MEKIDLKITRIDKKFDDIDLPKYSTDGSSGLDIRAAIENELILEAGKVILVPTNLRIEIPYGYEIEVRPRRGLAIKYGIGVLNSPGTIDSDYRGEIKIILFNFSNKDFTIKRGERIAQLVLSKVYKANLIEVKELNNSDRGDSGFGSSGLK